SLLMVVSQAVRVAGSVSAMLLKYCAKNWPRGQPGVRFTVIARVQEGWLPGLRTVTWAEPVAATSEAGMLAISRAALTNVVVRAAPFQSTVAPETKLPPSAVSVKVALPAVVLLGERKSVVYVEVVVHSTRAAVALI